MRKQKETVSLNFILKIKKVSNKEFCCGVGMEMCCSLYYYQHFPCQMMGILTHEVWNKSFKDRFAHTLDIPRRLNQKGDCNHAKFVTLQRGMFVKLLGIKSLGFLGQLT